MKLLLPSLVLTSLLVLFPMNAEAQKGWKTHTIEDEFSFKYPSNWDLEERENRFTSRDARIHYNDYTAQVQFEGSNPSDFGIIDEDDETIINVLESLIESEYDATIFESATDKYTINNKTAPYVLGTFSKDTLFGGSLDIVVMVAMVKVNPDEVVLVQYYAQEDDFDKYLPKIEQVLNSISPIGSIEGASLPSQ